MNVSDAAAGATRLTSPHDSANSRLKKATAIAATPRKKFELPSTLPSTVHRPERSHRSCTSPTCFMARARSTSPTTDADAIAMIAHQTANPVLSSFTNPPRSKPPLPALPFDTAHRLRDVPSARGLQPRSRRLL